MIFSDRVQAGKQLVERLSRYKGINGVVLGIPRGGVVVAHVVAQALGLPLDVVIARKIGAPDNPEYGLGAITANGTRWIDDESVKQLGISQAALNEIAQHEQQEAKHREQLYRQNRPAVDLQNKTVIVVDDGVAVGVTARVVLMTLENYNLERVVLATPVISSDTYYLLRDSADDLVTVQVASEFYAVGQFYESFPQVSDEEVMNLLSTNRSE